MYSIFSSKYQFSSWHGKTNKMLVNCRKIVSEFDKIMDLLPLNWEPYKLLNMVYKSTPLVVCVVHLSSLLSVSFSSIALLDDTKGNC